MNFYPFPILIEEIPEFHTYESSEAIEYAIDNWFQPISRKGFNLSVCYPINGDSWNDGDLEIANRKWAEVMWDWQRIIRRLQQPEDIENNEYVAERCP